MEALEGTPLVHPAATRRSGNPRPLVRRRAGLRASLVALLLALTGAILPAAASAALPSLGSASAPVARIPWSPA